MPKPAVETPKITAERRAVVKDRVELPRVYMAWLTSPIFKPGDADADIAATVLGGGRSSRLYKTLVYEKQIAQDVSAQQYSLTLGSVFQIEATARPGHTAEELEKAIDEELAKFREAGPDADRGRARAQRASRRGSSQGLETLGGFGGVADRLNMLQPLPRRSRATSPKDIQRYRDVDAGVGEGVRRSSSCTPTRRVVVHGVPGTAGSRRAGADAEAGDRRAPGAGAESINADEAWRKEPPQAGRGASRCSCRCRPRFSCRTA